MKSTVFQSFESFFYDKRYRYPVLVPVLKVDGYVPFYKFVLPGYILPDLFLAQEESANPRSPGESASAHVREVPKT
jgi:hypothetical protein